MGSAVEHASERAAIQKIHAMALAAGEPAVILVNFSVGGRQVDALVATANGSQLIEAKGLSQPTEGSVNGPWFMQTAAGPVTMGNGYIQALAAKNAVRDAMRRVAADPPYPDATVVVTPRVPPGSALTSGDHKVRVVGIDDLPLPERGRAPPWSLETWRTFARQNDLQRVAKLPALFDARLLAAETTLDDYSRRFRAAYGPRVASLLPFPCRAADGAEICSDAVSSQLDGGQGIVLLGPSGCGKTLVGQAAALDRLRAGDVPVVIEAKLFDGKLRAVLDAEVGLAGAASYEALSSAARRLHARLVFVVDGYNECPADLRFRLTRGVAALARRSQGVVLVSSQVPLEGGLLDLAPIHVSKPALALKTAIARSAAMAPLPGEATPLLAALESGLEARMLGEVGGDLAEGASRFALFDLYVRRRLGAQASAGIETLSRVAGRLADRLTFSLSVRDFDRLQEEAGAQRDVGEALTRAGLLVQRGDRVSFCHELYLQAFQAESVVRRAGGCADVITRALNDPRFAAAGPLVIGAIDDGALVGAVLDQVTSGPLVVSCMSGVAGAAARLWAERRCETVFALGVQEVEAASFQLDPHQAMQTPAEPSTLRTWSPQERAVLNAVPEWVNGPAHLPDLLAAARRVDARLEVEHRRLALAARQYKIALRSALFAQVYAWPGFGLSPAFGVNASLRRWRGSGEALVQVLVERVADLSLGEVHVLLELARHVSGVSRLMAPHLPALFDRYWTGAPYHLKLEMLEAAGSCWNAEDVHRRAVIETLEALHPVRHMMLTSQWFESMQQLGGFEDDEERQLEHLREQMPQILAQPNDPDEQFAAWTLYHSRFEHPLSAAYCRAYDELTPTMQAQILSMAAQVADIETFFAGSLIADLAAAGDPAQVAPIARWTVLPSSESMMPGDAVANFLLAHTALGRHGLELPTQSAPPEPAARALLACGGALHAANRADLTATEREARIAAAWAELSASPGAALVALEDCCSGHQDEAINLLPRKGPKPNQILDGHHDLVLDFARAAFADPSILTTWFRPRFFTPGPVLRFAASVLGAWGDHSDLERLRTMIGDPALADTALREIQRLEERLFKPAIAAR